MISFEDYKKQIEEWEDKWKKSVKNQDKWKGTSLEKMKNDYKAMKNDIEDAKYLRPISQNAFNQELSEYYSKVKQVLQPIEIMNIEENIELQILVLPSFSDNYQLLFTKNFLFYHYISNNQKNSKTYSLNEIDDANLSKDVIDFIENAKEPKGNRMVLDGVVFYFLSKQNNEFKVAYTHSPNEKSPTGQLVERIQKLFTTID